MNNAKNPFQDWLDSSQAFLGGQAMGPELAAKCEGLFKAWGRLADVMAKAGGAGAAGTQGGLFDPAGWVDLAGGGGFGDLWAWFGGEAPRLKSVRGSREWIAYGSALARYRAVLGAAWLAAFTRFAEEMTVQSGAPADLQAMQASWQRLADAELAAAQRSQPFLDAQRDLIRARIDCAAVIRREAEELGALLGLPGRGEVDALHQGLHDLRREVRALKDRSRSE